MSLTHEPDVSVADWVVGADEPWQVLASQGPAGFEAYATIRLGDSEVADADLVLSVTRAAAGFTSTPDRAWFALWDGWGELHEGQLFPWMEPTRDFGRIFTPPPPRQYPAAFPDHVMDGPVAILADATLGDVRTYLLFTGRVEDAGDWGARPTAVDWPRAVPQASFTWPADHAWCIASDVDPDWFTVGGSRALVDAVLDHPDLDAEPAEHGVLPPTQEPA